MGVFLYSMARTTGKLRAEAGTSVASLLWMERCSNAAYSHQTLQTYSSHAAGLKKGQARLKCGLKVVIYPEGTRNPSNELGSFKTGGAALAKLAGVDVVALAHNAGAYWPADSWLKYPGTIDVHIAPPLDSSAYSARELAEKAHSWVSAHLETTGS